MAEFEVQKIPFQLVSGLGFFCSRQEVFSFSLQSHFKSLPGSMYMYGFILYLTIVLYLILFTGDWKLLSRRDHACHLVGYTGR